MDKVWYIIRNILIVLLAVLVVLVTKYMFDRQSGYDALGDKDEYVAYDNLISIHAEVSSYNFDGPGTQTALIFYPESEVEAISYAPLMHKLAEEGIDCYLVRFPFRDPRLMGWYASYLTSNYNYKNWYIAGHGEGAFAAAKFVANHPDKVKGIMLLSGYAVKDMSEFEGKALLIRGSLDTRLDKSAYDEAISLLPARSTECVIEGANSSQFAEIELLEGDQAAQISFSAQMNKCAEVMLSFMK